MLQNRCLSGPGTHLEGAADGGAGPKAGLPVRGASGRGPGDYRGAEARYARHQVPT